MRLTIEEIEQRIEKTRIKLRRHNWRHKKSGILYGIIGASWSANGEGVMVIYREKKHSIRFPDHSFVSPLMDFLTKFERQNL